MFNPQYFNAHWYGPFSFEQTEEFNDPNFVIYMICGTHGIYGKSVPLYIGKTIRAVTTRLNEHKWIQEEPDPVQVYLAAISKPFHSWGELSKIPDDVGYPPLGNKLIEEIESLIIYSHQPVYNTRSKGGAQHNEQDIVVFNTGRRSTLLPEISSMYWYGDSAV